MHLLPCKPRPNRGIYLLSQLRRKDGFGVIMMVTIFVAMGESRGKYIEN